MSWLIKKMIRDKQERGGASGCVSKLTISKIYYDTTEVVLWERNDCLNSLPTLFMCCKNSLSDIRAHSLLNSALIRWSSFIKSGSFLLILSDLPWRGNFNNRIPLMKINSIDFQFCFYLDHVLKIPTCQNRNIIYGCNGYMKGVREISLRDNLSFNIPICQPPRLFHHRKNFYLVFFNGLFKKRFLRFLRRIFNFFYGCLQGIEVIIQETDAFKKLNSIGFNSKVLCIQPVYHRGINVYAHSLNLAQRFGDVKENRVISARISSSLAIARQAGMWQNWSREFKDIGKSGYQDLGIRDLGN